jgi:2-polyprenyl-3-methyl-5-hydroxy-6-metoxy-1,4-benzoquinol methylase
VTLDDPEVVRRDYASESRLLARRSIYETSEGPNALDVLWERIAEARPRRVLEVGPGPGELSERMAAELGADVVAVDVSPRMVELAVGASTHASATFRSCRSKTPASTSSSPRGCSSIPRISIVRWARSTGF